MLSKVKHENVYSLGTLIIQKCPQIYMQPKSWKAVEHLNTKQHNPK